MPPLPPNSPVSSAGVPLTLSNPTGPCLPVNSFLSGLQRLQANLPCHSASLSLRVNPSRPRLLHPHSRPSQTPGASRLLLTRTEVQKLLHGQRGWGELAEVLDVFGGPCQGRILQQRADPAHGGGDHFSGSGSGPCAGSAGARPSPAQPGAAAAASSPPRPRLGSESRPIGLLRRPDVANGVSQTTPGEPIASRPGTWLPPGPAPLTQCLPRAACCFREAVPRARLPGVTARVLPPGLARINPSLPKGPLFPFLLHSVSPFPPRISFTCLPGGCSRAFNASSSARKGPIHLSRFPPTCSPSGRLVGSQSGRV